MKMRFQRSTALKFIAKQPPKQKERILAAIERLPAGDVVALENRPGYYRLRIGDYRVVFSIDYVQDMISVYHVGNRGDVYKNL